MKLTAALIFLTGLTLVCAQNSSSAATGSSSAADSMQRKLERIEANARSAHPQPLTTTFTEQEVNAYVASGRVKLPRGVQSARFSGMPGVITSTARVDFDQLGESSSNPMLQIFSGVHNVDVTAHASGRGGVGTVHIDTVALDGVEIPDFVLELFVKHYIEPKYPNLGIDNRFQMPDRIDSAVVGNHELRVVQK